MREQLSRVFLKLPALKKFLEKACNGKNLSWVKVAGYSFQTYLKQTPPEQNRIEYFIHFDKIIN